MSDKITLPGQIQHSNPAFSIIDINDVRGGIKSVDVFDAPSLQNLLTTGGIDKFLLDHTVILERSSNSFFWMSGATPSSISSWTSISIEQDNRFRYIRQSFSIGGRGVPVEMHEQLIGERIQDYFDDNTFVIEDTELIIFVFTITEYGLFLTHDRKYTFPNMLGKGTYDVAHSNELQYDELELMYKSGSGTTTETILIGSVNNIIVDIGDITGDELINYVNTNGDTYDFSDMTKIYYFKFILDSVDYIYYFEGDDSVNGYGLYGLGEFQFDDLDLTLFYSSDAPVISPIFSQDNRFRFVEFKVTLKGKKNFPTVTNTIPLLREQVNNIFTNNNLSVYDTELIIFKFFILDPRVGGKYIWKYFFKNMQGKGVYAPIYPTITFDDLEVAHQDLTFIQATPADVELDVNNVVFDLGTYGYAIIIPNFLNTYTPVFDMNDNSKIYFFKYVSMGVEYMWYYSGDVYGTYGLGNLQFPVGDVEIFYNSSLYTGNEVSLSSNIPRKYDIASTDINKPIVDISESDVIDYINTLNDPLLVSPNDSMMLVNVYQPQIDIYFNDINLIGVTDLNNKNDWDNWTKGVDIYNVSIKDVTDRNFRFTEINYNSDDSVVSFVGDLNNISSFLINGDESLYNPTPYHSFNNIVFGRSNIDNISIVCTDFSADLSNMIKIGSLYLEGSMNDISVCDNIDSFYIASTVDDFTLPIQVSRTMSHYFDIANDDGVTLDNFDRILYSLVQSPIGNTGSFLIGGLYASFIPSVTGSNYISTLEARGWYFDDSFLFIAPFSTSTSTTVII